MKYILVILLFFISCGLASQVLPPLYQVTRVTDTRVNSQYPGGAYHLIGTKFVLHYSQSTHLLESIQKYTIDYFHGPDMSTENQGTWVLQSTTPSNSECWLFNDYFRVKQIHPLNGASTYRVSDFDYDGYLLRDMYYTLDMTLTRDICFYYTDEHRLTEKVIKHNSNSFEKHQFDYDDLGRRSFKTCYTSADSLNWNPIDRTEYTYSALPLPVDFNPEKYEDYLGNIYPVPGIPNKYKLESSSTYDYANNAWVWNATYPMYLWGTLGFDMLPYYGTGIYTGVGLFKENYILGYSGFYDRSVAFDWAINPVSNEDEYASVLAPLINCYPNPFKESCNIELKMNGFSPMSLSIFNLRGQRVRKLEAKPEDRLLWDGNDEHGKPVNPGIYFFMVNNGSKQYTKKVIKL